MPTLGGTCLNVGCIPSKVCFFYKFELIFIKVLLHASHNYYNLVENKYFKFGIERIYF